MTDPLKVNSPDATRELFDLFRRTAAGFPLEAAVGAGANMILNAIRQQAPKKADAEVAFDELFGRMKAILLEHYDSVSGNRRAVFPFTQHLEPKMFDASKDTGFIR